MYLLSCLEWRQVRIAYALYAVFSMYCVGREKINNRYNSDSAQHIKIHLRSRPASSAT
jgi:hypothetical protein